MRSLRLRFLVLVSLVAGCSANGPESGPVDVGEENLTQVLDLDFSGGDEHDVVPLFRDVPVSVYREYERRRVAGESLGPVAPLAGSAHDHPEEASHWLMNAGIHPMPDGIEGKGFLIQGNNHSDDMDMHLARKLGAREGIEPNARYAIVVTVDLAGDAQSGAFGIGGGQDLSLYASVTRSDPREIRIDAQQHVRFADFHPTFAEMKGVGTNSVCFRRQGSLPIPPGQAACPSSGRISFQLKRGRPSQPLTIDSDARGEIWLLVGGHSGYEDFSAIYYKRIVVSVRRLSGT
jgi:hypothetical protein